MLGLQVNGWRSPQLHRLTHYCESYHDIVYWKGSENLRVMSISQWVSNWCWPFKGLQIEVYVESTSVGWPKGLLITG